MGALERAANVEHEVERLGADETIEATFRKLRGIREIGDEGRARGARRGVEHRALRHAPSAEAIRVGAVPHLEHAPSNPLRLPGEELLDVAPVDRRAAVEPEDGAHGLDAVEASQVDGRPEP